MTKSLWLTIAMATFGVSAANIDDNRWEISYGENACYSKSMLPISSVSGEAQLSVVVGLARTNSEYSIKGRPVKGRVIQVQVLDKEGLVEQRELLIGAGKSKFQAISQYQSELGWHYFLINEDAEAVWGSVLKSQDMVVEAPSLGKFSFSLDGTNIVDAMMSACAEVVS
ncbi:hypothetical protein [Ferrimonas balearica]|uniref:hypothetical protein n=1 Tax=Ferrimonas balearica TaxID=44012 RepID=UPI001C99C22E|nr:hypothetical protein [Ferrimonas balearica]MBY5920272.1 hypothetical protein [Ferrimonas balearica]MBY5997043.1 hypothetical protein [Ferrimonas balearica]